MTEDSQRNLQADALDLFMRSLEQPTEWRDEWLDEQVTADAQLAAEVMRLRQADETRTAFLGEAPVLADRTGDVLGRWKLDSVIATGGMGRVYKAQRVDAEFSQLGALKIMRHQMDSGSELGQELLRRFHIERQVLANISHPNVAAVLDGGTTSEGLPYLVMEYVAGVDIMTHAKEKKLNLEQRLRLFQTLLAAMGAVHRNLVVHRDLKPSNILVDTQGHLKLLDFGIAKVLQAQPGLNTSETTADARAMTPDYASPEQLTGDPVTVATDIYALGLLLYRLLTGVPAYSVSTLPLVKVQEIICNTDPVPPSETLRSLPEPELSASQLAGDIDAIVMKAVRKEANARYGSAAEMSNDIENFLNGNPVSAQQDTATYRLGKYLRRNRLLLASVASVIVALSVGLGVALWQADLARMAADEAEREARKSEAVTEFLQDVFIQADPLEHENNPTVREALDGADAQIEDRFVDHPEVEAAVRRTLGWTQLSLGRVEVARPNLEQAYEMNRAFYGDAHHVTLKNLGDLAWLAHEADDSARSIGLYQQALSKMNADTPLMLQATVRNDLGVVLDYANKTTEAIEQYNQAILIYNQLDSDSARTQYGSAVGNIAAAYHTAGDMQLAEENYLKHIELSEAAIEDGLKGERSNLMFTLNNYAILLAETQRVEEALVPMQRSAQLREEILGIAHPSTARVYMNLSRLRFEQGQLELARQAFDKFELGTTDMSAQSDTMLRANLLRLWLQHAEDPSADVLSEAERLIPQYAELPRDRYGEMYAQALMLAGSLNAKSSFTARATQQFQQALQVRLERYDADHYLIENTYNMARGVGIELPPPP